MATRKPVTSTPEKRRSAWNDGPWNEIAGIVLIGIGLVILIALLSYTSNDPSINTTGKNPRANNPSAQTSPIFFFKRSAWPRSWSRSPSVLRVSGSGRMIAPNYTNRKFSASFS
jgi:hypothetical protein